MMQRTVRYTPLPIRAPRPARSNLLALSLAATLLGLTGSLAPKSAEAAEGNSASMDSRQIFSIPGGKLSDTLARFAASAGVPLAFDPRLLDGMQSDGLQGRYALQEGFATLLEGSGYIVQEQSKGRYTLIKLSDPLSVLPPVTITSSALANSTEESGAYTLQDSSTATKLHLTPRQTPQIINSVTHQMIEDFAMEDMEDVMNMVPGVSVGHSDDDRRNYTARGYAMSIQYDGLPSTSGIDGGVVAGPDSALIDRTEVLLGATGLMNGAGQPGGTINMVYKRPTETFQASASLSLGSWEMQRSVADLSGPLNESGRVRARLVAVEQTKDAFRDYEQERKKVFYTVVEGDLSDTTLLSFSIQKQDIYDNVTDRSGLPTDNNGKDLNWDRSTFLAPAWNQWNKYATTYKARLEQQLPENWELTVQASMLTSEADWLFGGLSSFDSTTGDAVFSRWAQYNKETSDDVELYLSGPVNAFGREHEVVIGGNWTKRIWAGISGSGTDYATNLYDFDPQSSIPRPEIVLDTPLNDQITRQYGGYIATHLNISDATKAIIGSRVSWYDYTFGATKRDENAELTPYFGLTYDVTQWASAYLSYSDIFNPQTARGLNGNTLEPEVGSNYEIGLKGEFYDGKLNTSLATFKIEKDNEALMISSIPYDATNPCGGWCYRANGETTTRGIDLGASGELMPGLQIMSGLSVYKKDDNDKTVRIFKLSSSYSPVDQNWSAGASLDSSSKSYGSWGMSQDARTLLGVFAKYRLNDIFSVGLNINNLLDKKYYANAIDSGYGNQYWGEPRAWALSLNGQW